MIKKNSDFYPQGFGESPLQIRQYELHKQGSKAHATITLSVEFKGNTLVTYWERIAREPILWFLIKGKIKQLEVCTEDERRKPDLGKCCMRPSRPVYCLLLCTLKPVSVSALETVGTGHGERQNIDSRRQVVALS